ncbi:MAG: peptidoglycan DD-metalloendopeptidase family protein [Dethiobacteria bacterium]
MLRVYLKLSCFSVKKVLAFFRKILPVLLAFMLVGGSLCFFPWKAGAQAPAQRMRRPSYLEQLEKYSAGVKQHKKEQERLKREETLKKAVIQHVVQPGETLTHIAREHRIDLESLICWNGITDPHLIFPGEVLDLLSIQGTMHIVRQGDTVEDIADRYQSKPQVITAFNLLEEPPVLTPGEKLVIPGGTLSNEERQAVQATLLASRYGKRGPLPPNPVFDWPVKGRISSNFGWRKGAFHYGLDIAVPHGSTIRAAAAGVVAETGTKQGYGLMLVIGHSDGWRTLYAHCSRLLVKRNEKVFQGQPVALIGATGNATGPHLHLEIGHGERRFDPLLFLSGD